MSEYDFPFERLKNIKKSIDSMADGDEPKKDTGDEPKIQEITEEETKAEGKDKDGDLIKKLTKPGK